MKNKIRHEKQLPVIGQIFWTNYSILLFLFLGSFFRLQASGKLTNNALDSAGGEPDNHDNSSHDNSGDEAGPFHGDDSHGDSDVPHDGFEEISDGDFTDSDGCHDNRLCKSDKACSNSVSPDDGERNSAKAELT